MQQILLVTNALTLNTSSVDFAAYVANVTKSRVIGLFLEQYEKAYSAVPQGAYEFTGEEEAITDYSNPTISNELVRKNMQLFKETCTRHNVSSSIHYLKGIAVDEIIKESRFADLIIIDGGTSFNTENMDGIPSNFVKTLLARAECPVIISPFKFDEVNEIIFTYDGSNSSVFAIKQFTYLFPQLDETKITLIQIAPGEVNELTENDKLKRWLMMHYNAVHFEILHGAADEELFKKLVAKRNKFLVMGAYGRRMLLDHSTADLVLKTIDIPVFIAHH